MCNAEFSRVSENIVFYGVWSPVGQNQPLWSRNAVPGAESAPVVQNICLVTQNAALVVHNSGLVVQNTALVFQSADNAVQDTALVVQNTISVFQKTTPVAQNQPLWSRI